MFYTCNQCRYTFKKSGKVERCVDCGKPNIRESTKKEKEEYRRNQKEREDWDNEIKNKK